MLWTAGCVFESCKQDTREDKSIENCPKIRHSNVSEEHPVDWVGWMTSLGRNNWHSAPSSSTDRVEHPSQPEILKPKCAPHLLLNLKLYFSVSWAMKKNNQTQPPIFRCYVMLVSGSVYSCGCFTVGVLEVNYNTKISYSGDFNYFFFHPYLAKWSNLTISYFSKMGLFNHQLL